jgi:diguanylate cyclase
VIEILKEFSATKHSLSSEILTEALSGNKEVCELLHQPETRYNGSSMAIRRVPLRIPAPERQSNLPETLQEILDTFDMVLAHIQRIAQKETMPQYSELRRRLLNCATVNSLVLEKTEIVRTVNSVVSRAAEQIDFANDFIIKLSEYLSVIESQLFSYQSHTQETFVLQGEFSDDILSQTQEMNQAVVLSKAVEEAREIISSRLSLIGNAIATKRQEDEARLKEADSKITQLQMNVRNYNEEIDKVTRRAKELEQEVLLDPLLNINNRRSYDLKIMESLRDYHLRQQPFSLILIDVDHFKQINDGFGHIAGDRCLHELAKLVAGCVRKTDFLARYGGEELVLIMPGGNTEDAKNVAEKIRERIDRARFYYQGEVIHLTISLGVTAAQPSDTDAERLFIRVDEAMYHAKREGRNRVIVV